MQAHQLRLRILPKREHGIADLEGMVTENQRKASCPLSSEPLKNVRFDHKKVGVLAVGQDVHRPNAQHYHKGNCHTAWRSEPSSGQDGAITALPRSVAGAKTVLFWAS